MKSVLFEACCLLGDKKVNCKVPLDLSTISK